MADPGSGKAKVVVLKSCPCPMCGRPAVAEYRPFCSRRCADLDLGHWLREDYRIASDEGPDLEEEPPDGGGEE